LKSIAGVVLSHGYCRRHELELLERERLITRPESVELWARRNFVALLLIATGAAMLAVLVHHFGTPSPSMEPARAATRVSAVRSTGAGLAGGVPPFLGQEPKAPSIKKFREHPQRVRVASTHGLADVPGPRCTIFQTI
jgi:hypothetical protein